jgi:hypothetical protein
MTRDCPLGPMRKWPAAQHAGTRSQAAESLRPMLAELQKRVLAFIAGRGTLGATDQEISLGLKMKSDTSRARRVELRDLGLVFDSGRHRPTDSGRAAAVWVASISQEMATPKRAPTGHVENTPSQSQTYPCADF